MRPTPYHEYRIAPELRRCCWYAIIGAFALAAVFSWVVRFVQHRGPVDILVGCAFFALLAAATLVPLRWKVRIDQHGISRRLLFRWDLWPWATLASGRVSKLDAFTLYDPDRPWWRRRLRLDCMASADTQEVVSAINAHYRLPTPPSLPATLAIKYGFRRSATFGPNGIHLIVRGIPHEYLWRDLRDIHITRMDPLRRDFRSLVINLPDQELKLKLITHQGGSSQTWRGATAEELNEFLFQFVPTDRFLISIVGRRSTQREVIERELKEAKKQTRAFMIATPFILSLLLGHFAWMAIADGMLKAVASSAMYAVIIGPVMFLRYRSQCKKASELMELLKDTAAMSAPNRVANNATERNGEPKRLLS